IRFHFLRERTRHRAGHRLLGRRRRLEPLGRLDLDLVIAVNPVPAGMRCPMMMFSLSPNRSSLAPRIAASVNTLVVSWNDAAEMNDCVVRLALVMPNSTGSA